MRDLIQKVDKLEDTLERLKVLEGGGSSSVSDASATAKGITKLSVAPVSPTNPIAVGDNDTRMTNSRTPTGSAGGDLAGTYPNPTINPITVTQTVLNPGSLSILATGQILFASSDNGIAFPGSPSTNQRYFRNDRGIEYYYDGTRWLGPQVVTTLTYAPPVPASNTISATTATVMVDSHPDNSSDVYVEKIITIFNVASANGVANNWRMDVRFRNSAGTTITTLQGDTSAGTASGLQPITINYNAVITRANFYNLQVDFTKVGSPGSGSFNPVKMYYRLVG